ncbi:MAG: cyclic nucleotide-binding domain-containing protein [Nitrospinae bacterium]|nr:cyclic nucleotide-binding domain-containing protein [Nitrospinota bacterium]
MDVRGVKALMCEIPMFDQIRPDDVTVMASYLEYRKVTPGTVLAAEGQTGDSVFFIVSGKIEIKKEGMDGKLASMGFRGKGTSVGEISLVSDNPIRIATVVAKDPSEILVLSRVNFEKIEAKNPSIAIRILKNIASTLSQRVGQLSGKLADLA